MKDWAGRALFEVERSESALCSRLCCNNYCLRCVLFQVEMMLDLFCWRLTFEKRMLGGEQGQLREDVGRSGGALCWRLSGVPRAFVGVVQ